VFCVGTSTLKEETTVLSFVVFGVYLGLKSENRRVFKVITSKHQADA